MAEKKTGNILLIANGQPPAADLLQNLLQQTQTIIAVNGGSVICYQNRIQPDFIVGDLDSLQPDLQDYFESARLIHRPDQNFHDLEKAIEFAQTLEPDAIKIVAAFGKRADQTLANLLTLQNKFKQARLEIYDDFGRLEIITATHEVNLPVGQTISLFSFLPVFGITLHGFKYGLQNADYTDGFNGLSNVITARPAQIIIKQGSLFLYTLQTHD